MRVHIGSGQEGGCERGSGYTKGRKSYTTNKLRYKRGWYMEGRWITYTIGGQRYTWEGKGIHGKGIGNDSERKKDFGFVSSILLPSDFKMSMSRVWIFIRMHE